jgi:hypothetical protein
MRPTFLWISSVSLFLAACATSPDGTAPRLTGKSGSVAWEVVDMGRITRSDGMRLRWSYTIVLRETAGSAVQFESLEYGNLTHSVATGGFRRSDFYRRIEAGKELRLSVVDSWGYSAAGSSRQFGATAELSTMIVERRYIGKNVEGQPVVVPVRLELHRGSGRQSRQPASSEGPLPPPQLLQAADLGSLAGQWQGYYQAAGFHLPMAATIGTAGSIEFAENDPVTNRFRGTLILQDGRLTYSGRDSGELVLHQDGARRVLAGLVFVSGSDTVSVRLERVSATAARAAP